MSLVLNAELRLGKGKSEVKKIRSKGKIPGVIYGDEKQSISVQIDRKELENLVLHAKGDFVLIDLSLQNQSSVENQKIFLKDIQRDPVSGKIVHCDLYRVSMKNPIRLEVPMHLIGISIGSKNGGVMEYVTRSLEIRCLPDIAPRFIEVDVSNVNINQSIHVSNLSLGEGIEILTSPESVIVTCGLAKKEEVAVAAVEVEAGAEEELKEPEIIGKGKAKEGEEGEEEASGEKK